MLRREVKRTFRVAIQTLVAPVISASFVHFYFWHGYRLSNCTEVSGVPYMTFVFPGILMLSCNKRFFRKQLLPRLYFMRFTRGIEEILITPFSYLRDADWLCR
jgi:hypothetical protein